MLGTNQDLTAKPLMTPGTSRVENRVAILCTLALVLEGYDIGAMSFTIPSLSEAWHLRPVAFTAALTAGNVGLLLGSLFCGWLGDRFGRKPVLMGCVAAFGVMSLLTVLVTTPALLTAARLGTGIGLGGGIPTCIALLSDFSPRKRQGGLVMAMGCGVPAGNVAGGIVASRLLAPYGWQSVFLVGGIAPLIVLPLLAFLLPESAEFIASRREMRSSKTADGPSSASYNPPKNLVAELFKYGFARLTVLLWLINFLSLVTIYFINSWMPSMLHSLGIKTETAILASIAFQVGGIVGGIASAPVVNRFGTEKVVSAMLAMGGGWILLIALTNVSTFVLGCFIFGAGLGISAGQVGINALSGAIYPPPIRSTGSGWAIGIGRLGNITGPLFGGLLLSLNWTPKHMLLTISAPVFFLASMLLILASSRASGERSLPLPGVGHTGKTLAGL